MGCIRPCISCTPIKSCNYCMYCLKVCISARRNCVCVHVHPCNTSKDILQCAHSTLACACTERDMQIVEKNVKKKSLNTWYEAQLLTDVGKSKRVYCYISPRVSAFRHGISSISVLPPHFCEVAMMLEANQMIHV